MSMTLRTLCSGLVALTLFGTAHAGSNAAPAAQPKFILPDHDYQSPLRLGIFGSLISHRGILVHRVPYGSLGSRIGLERGDLIVRANGVRIRHEADYFEGLARTGRYLDLLVRDARGRGYIPVRYDMYRPAPWQPRPYVAPTDPYIAPTS